MEGEGAREKERERFPLAVAMLIAALSLLLLCARLLLWGGQDGDLAGVDLCSRHTPHHGGGGG